MYVSSLDTMADSIDEKREFRIKMNDLILENGGKNIKRFFALDSRVYEKGALDISSVSFRIEYRNDPGKDQMVFH